MRRLQEYERFQARRRKILDALPRQERDFSLVQARVADRSVEHKPPEVDMRELLLALKEVMLRRNCTAITPSGARPCRFARASGTC